MNKFSNDYEVLTPSGWQGFDGIRAINTLKKLVKVVLSDTDIKCTHDHQFRLTNGIFKQADQLIPGDLLDGNTPRLVIEIVEELNVQPVYDLLEVKNGHVYLTNGVTSHNCQFIGSSGTLIASDSLKALAPARPMGVHPTISQFKSPTEGHTYCLIADVSRGKGLDYSTFSVVDVTKMPYEQVCTFRDNLITPGDFASYIFRFGKMYNEANVLIEVNDIGGQVADLLFLDYGYENILFTESGGRNGRRISSGFGKKVDRGIRTTVNTKMVGCSILKLLIEQQQFIINDHHTIEELKRFSRKGKSYEAEAGSHDDMVMTLVIFAWLSDQNFFQHLTEIHTMSKLRDLTEDQIQSEVLPFGFIVAGEPDSPQSFVDNHGDMWM